MEIEKLIDSTAAAVARAYDQLDFEDCAGVLLYPYFGSEPEELAPLALELRADEVTPDVHRNGYQEELGTPDVPAEIGRKLCGYLEQAPDGYVLIERFWLALANELHARLGFPVLVCEIEMPIAEQLARQLRSKLADPLAHLDVRIAQSIDEDQVAAIWFDREMQYLASARAPVDARPLELNIELSLDPEIRAGWLPPGATGVALLDRTGTSHTARTAGNLWLCVLPQRSGQKGPTLTYHDVEGDPFPMTIETTTLPALWPRQAPEYPSLAASSEGYLSYEAGEWTASAKARVGFKDVAFRPIPGSVLGQSHGIGIELIDDGWRAVASCGTFTVEVEGPGGPPARLDLDVARPRRARRHPG